MPGFERIIVLKSNWETSHKIRKTEHLYSHTQTTPIEHYSHSMCFSVWVIVLIVFFIRLIDGSSIDPSLFDSSLQSFSLAFELAAANIQHLTLFSLIFCYIWSERTARRSHLLCVQTRLTFQTGQTYFNQAVTRIQKIIRNHLRPYKKSTLGKFGMKSGNWKNFVIFPR